MRHTLEVIICCFKNAATNKRICSPQPPTNLACLCPSPWQLLDPPLTWWKGKTSHYYIFCTALSTLHNGCILLSFHCVADWIILKPNKITGRRNSIASIVNTVNSPRNLCSVVGKCTDPHVLCTLIHAHSFLLCSSVHASMRVHCIPYLCYTIFPAPDTTVIITNYTAVNSSELFLQWMVTDTDTLNGDITGYEVVYTYSDQDGDMVKSILVNSTVTDVVSIFVVHMCITIIVHLSCVDVPSRWPDTLYQLYYCCKSCKYCWGGSPWRHCVINDCRRRYVIVVCVRVCLCQWYYSMNICVNAE